MKEPVFASVAFVLDLAGVVDQTHCLAIGLTRLANIGLAESVEAAKVGLVEHIGIDRAGTRLGTCPIGHQIPLDTGQTSPSVTIDQAIGYWSDQSFLIHTTYGVLKVKDIETSPTFLADELGFVIGSHNLRRGAVRIPHGQW